MKTGKSSSMKVFGVILNPLILVAQASLPVALHLSILQHRTTYNLVASQQDLIMNLGNFLFEYNHLRKHGGLNYETPFDKLQKVTELLS